MKKYKLFLSLFLLLSVSLCQGADLVAYYSFDNSSNLGKDDSGNGKDLVAYDETPPVYISDGKVGGAADFDGSTQGFLTPIGVQPAGSFSVAAWVKFDTIDPAQNQQVITMGYSHTGFQMKTAWDPAEYAFGTEYSDGAVWVRPGITVSQGEWHHIAMTFESASGPDSNNDYTGTIRAYIDGVLVETVTDAKYQADASNKQCIGRRSGDYLDGQIDEFAIYYGCLTNNEIEGLADVSNVVAHYSFDDSSNLGKDDSGNSNDLVAYDGTPPGYISDGKVGGAADFDGSTQGFLTPTGIQPAGSFSVAAWVKFDTIDPAQNQQVVTTGFSHTGFQMKTAWTPAEYAFGTEYSDGAVWVRPRVEIPEDKWQHMAMTFEAVSGPDPNGDYTGIVKAYIDGVLVETVTDVKYQADASNKQCIGRRAGDYLDGKIDEFTIYRTALTDSEIKDIAGVSDVVAYYSFDDSSNLGKDDSENSNDLVAYDGTPPVYISDGKVEGAADFDGSTQGFLTPTGIQPDGSFTVASWVKFDTISSLQNQQVITMGFSHTGFQIKTAWQPVEYAFVTEYSDGYVQVRPRFEIPKDEWEHVAMTYEALSGPDANGDYTGTIKCYLNGIFIGSQTDAKYQADFSNKQCIGRRAGYYLDGKLDEFVIYRKALSESQIYGLATGDYDPVNLPDTEIEFDINNDGSVNLIDFAEISKYWLKSSY